MDRELNNTIQEKIKIRKEIKPILDDLGVKIDELKEAILSLNRETPDLSSLNNLKYLVDKEVQKVEVINNSSVIPEIQKVEVVNKDKVSKVEVINQPKQTEFKVEKVEFPELQKVYGEIKATNLPLGSDVEPSSKKADPSKYLIVRLSDGKQFINPYTTVATAQSQKQGDHLFLREEYTYSTVSGIQVVTRITKYSDNVVLTEDYTYDSNANVIKKFRSIEPYA